MRTWTVKGDTSGETIINPASVEVVVVEEMSPAGEFSVRIRLGSGKEYYGVFESEAARSEFLEEWSDSSVEVSGSEVSE